MFVLQPYLFIKNNYASFSSSRKSIKQPNVWSVNPSLLFQMGLLSSLDFTLNAQGVYSKRGAIHASGLGDSEIALGFQLIRESQQKPGLRLALTESFPTGRYQKLNPKKMGIDATGSGAYTTTCSLNLSKVFWWMANHPFSWRLSLNYAFPTMPLEVKDWNAYGGGHGTKGKVRPGNSATLETSIELSFTQKWVFALDLAYNYQDKTTFHGKKGWIKPNQVASVGMPSSDNLSFAPAIEYNHSDHLGMLAGVWFSALGRNSGNFATGVLTLYYAW